MRSVILLTLLSLSSCTQPHHQFHVVTSNPPPAPVETSQARLGTRMYVGSVLREVFGGESISSVAEAVHELVEKKLAPFAGGPCDRYGNDCPLANNGTGRPDPGGESQSSVVPTATSSRFALTIRACEKITSLDEAVRFAAQQITGENMLAQPSHAQITLAFQIFFPDRTPNETILIELSRLTRQAALDSKTSQEAALEAWRFLLLALCDNPAWQIP